jgi:hypothetical protein
VNFLDQRRAFEAVNLCSLTKKFAIISRELGRLINPNQVLTGEAKLWLRLNPHNLTQFENVSGYIEYRIGTSPFPELTLLMAHE